MKNKTRFTLRMWMCSLGKLLTTVVCAAQITVAPPPNPNLTPVGPHRPQPPGQQQQMTRPTAQQAHSPSAQRENLGVISGYIYWDPKTVSYAQSTPCKGITLFVQAGNPPKTQPGFEQFQTFTSDKNLTPLNTIGPYAVCAYSVSKVPTGMDLQVIARVDAMNVFPGAGPLAQIPPTANDPGHPINIPGGSCNQLPPAVPSASVLNSAWWTCGNDAYNVNFVVQPATPYNNSASGGGTLTPVSGTSQSGPLLNGNSQSRGMLQPANPGTVQAPSNAQPGTPQMLVPAVKPGPGGTSELNPQPYPPKGVAPAAVTPTTPSSTVPSQTQTAAPQE